MTAGPAPPENGRCRDAGARNRPGTAGVSFPTVTRGISMSDFRTELGQVIYNPETRAYEALVTFHEDGEAVRIPCALAFPIDADRHVVASALVRQAREIRRNARVPLMSRLRAAPDAGRIVSWARRGEPRLRA